MPLSADSMILKIKTLVIAFAIVVAVTGCRPVKHVTTDQRHDSVVYLERTVVKDSLIRVPVPADSALIEAIVECDSLNQAHIAYIVSLTDGARAQISMKLDNNVLTLGCRCDSLTIYSIYHSRYQQIAESATNTTVMASTTEVRQSLLENWVVILALAFLSVVSLFLSINYLLDHVKRNQERN